jgi:hypothetical protein
MGHGGSAGSYLATPSATGLSATSPTTRNPLAPEGGTPTALRAFRYYPLPATAFYRYATLSLTHPHR